MMVWRFRTTKYACNLSNWEMIVEKKIESYLYACICGMFHGGVVCSFGKKNTSFEKVVEKSYKKALPMLHSDWGKHKISIRR